MNTESCSFVQLPSLWLVAKVLTHTQSEVNATLHLRGPIKSTFSPGKGVPRHTRHHLQSMLSRLLRQSPTPPHHSISTDHMTSSSLSTLSFPDQNALARQIQLRRVTAAAYGPHRISNSNSNSSPRVVLSTFLPGVTIVISSLVPFHGILASPINRGA